MVAETVHNSVQIFDRPRLRQNRKAILPNFENYDFLFKWAEDQILDRLDMIKHEFTSGVHIGGRQSNNFIKHLKTQTNIDSFFTLDCAHGDVIGEEDFLPLKPSSLDLITSTLCLHSVNDLPGALLQIKKALKPDGLFIAALFGGETLHELRESLMSTEVALKGGASPRVFPFADKQDMGALLQRAGFTLPVVDSDIVHVSYDHLFKLADDLRGMGENNVISARNKQNPGKNFFMSAAKYYAENFSIDNAKIQASFEIIFLIGWSPDSCQQQPLKPGSAKNRLADALRTNEVKVGENP